MGRSCRGLDRRRCAVALGFLLCFFSALDAREIESRHDFFSQIYNHTVATILVEYASAVYISDLTELFTWTCSRCDGKIEAFEIVSIIVDVKNCLQAFVGVDKNLNSIVVAFRGTQEHSIQNWIEDLFWKQLDLNYPGMPDAMVHHGFYYAYHNTTLRDGILDGILHAKNLYGDIGIVVTGHSMGGAIASFCALDLAVNYKVKTVQLMTFGQPRIGNEIFSSYFSEHVPHAIRVTNRNDMVPHLPPYYYFFPSKTYHHFPREVWIYDIILGSLVYEAEKICDSSGEDPNCSRSLSRKDIQVLVSHGCPSLDGKVIQSSKLLRKLAHVNEGDVCSACSLRSTCKKGFLLVPKEDEARTLDVVRVLLTFGFDSINGLVQNKPLTKLKSVKMVIRKLLHQIVKLSSVPIDPNLPRPVIKKPIPKVKQAPPLPKKRVGRDDVEMKKGDWLCEKCDFMNFAKNAICLQCDAKRPKRQLLPGEWECPQCNFLNYRRNMECFHCECKRPHDEFMESQSHAKKHEPRVGPPGNLRAPNVSDAWNFDFDENESDGADVAAFEFADPPRRGEGASLNAEPHGETSRRWSDDHVDYDKMQRNHEGSRQFVDSNDRNPHPHASRTGFDDFDDEEDDVDSYEIDMKSDYKTSVARKNFSEFENESEAEEFNDIRHRQDAKQSIDDSDGDMMGFDSEVNIPDFPSLKTRRNRDISYGSEDDVNLHSDSDGDFSTETRRRSRKISDRKQNLSSDRMSGSRSAFENADAVRQSRGAQRNHQGLNRDDFSSRTGSNDKTRWDSGFEDNNFSGYTKHNRRGDTGTFKRPSRRLGFDRRGDADSDDRPRWGSKFEDSDFSGRMEHNRSDDAGSYNRPSRDSGFDRKSDAGNDDILRRGSKFEDSDFSGLMEHNRSGDAVSYNRSSRGSGFDQRGGTRSNDRPRRNSGFEDSDFSGRTEYNRRSNTGGFNQSSRGLGFDRRGAKGSSDRHRLESDRSGGRRGCDSTGFDRPFREVRSIRSRSDERPYRRINER